MQPLCRTKITARVFSCWTIPLLPALQWSLVGWSVWIPGWLALLGKHKPCGTLSVFGSLFYSKVKNQVETGWSDFKPESSGRRAALSFSPSTPLQRDTVQTEVTDIRYSYPLLIEAHGMINIEKDFELAWALQSRIFWPFCWFVQGNGKPLRFS